MSLEFDGRYTDYQLNRSWLRKAVRQVYLRKALTFLKGPTLDFGCGVGELLARLPQGSRGLEYNLATVEHCRRLGLPVDPYDGSGDDWSLSVLPSGTRFQSMVISHVLEHLESPTEILRKLLVAGARHGVECVLVIVPGKAGFKVDATHRTFIDLQMLSTPEVPTAAGFSCVRAGYFPGNVRLIGDWFAYHELQALFVRSGDDA